MRVEPAVTAFWIDLLHFQDLALTKVESIDLCIYHGCFPFFVA